MPHARRRRLPLLHPMFSPPRQHGRLVVVSDRRDLKRYARDHGHKDGRHKVVCHRNWRRPLRKISEPSGDAHCRKTSPAPPRLTQTYEIESSRTHALFYEPIITRLHKKHKIFYSRIIVKFLTINKNDKENTAVIRYHRPACLYEHVMSLKKMLDLSAHIGNCGADHRSARVRTGSIPTARDGRPVNPRTN